MAELLTKRTIECVDQDVSKSPTEDMCRSKKTKWGSDERNVHNDGQTSKPQDEDRNNSNGPVKVKVTVSEVNEHFDATVSNPIPYRIVVGANYKNRNFDDEAQKASNILKNIVMEKMNDKMADEPSMSMFQGVQQNNYQPSVPLTCKTSNSRPALPLRYLPAQSNLFPPFVRGQNIAASGNLTSLPQTGIPRLLQQSGRFVVQPITSISSTVRSLPPTCGTVPTATIIPPSTGIATQSTGTMTSTNDQSLPSTEYLNKISSSAIKTAAVQVMPGTCMTYKTPGASFRNRHGKVKRPMNAFMVWARNYRSRLSEEMPQASNAQISVRLGQIWGSMSLADKEKYFREAERIKLQHNRDFPGWVYQPKQKKVPIETQHDRLWARFGSNKEQLPQSTNSCPEVPVTSVQQTVTPTPVTVYPKTPIATTANISITSPLPSFSQLTQTVSDLAPIVSLETGLNPTQETLATNENIKSELLEESTDSSQGSARRPTAFKIVGNSQAPAVTVPIPPKKEQPTPMTSFTVCNSPLKMTTSCPTATGSVRSLSSTLTGCFSPKGRPPSISRRIPATPAMLISSQRAYKEAILTKSHSSSPTKSKSTSSGPSLTTTSDQRQQKSNVTLLTTASDVTPTASQRFSKCADPVDELWPFPLPTIEQTHHVDVLYDDHLRYERESGPGYIDPYNPFYYDGSYDETRSGLQVDVNSWQKYLNYTKMQNETEDKTNLTKYFPPPSTSCSSVMCEQMSNNADNYAQQATHSKQNGNGQEPRRTSSESCFASSLTSAINVLDDVHTGGTPDGYADLNLNGYQNKSPRASRDVVDLQSESCALQALDLSSGSRAQTSVSNIVYLGQETTHMGAGDGVKTVYIEGSPPGKPEDSRPLKKRTERYRRDFINGGSDFTSGDVPAGTYLEDVVFLTSPEKADAEDLSCNLPQGSGYIVTGQNRDHVTSPKLIIDVGNDFVQSLKSGTVITDLTPVDLSNAKSVQGRPSSDQTLSQIHDTTETAGNTETMDTEQRVVSIKKEKEND